MPLLRADWIWSFGFTQWTVLALYFCDHCEQIIAICERTRPVMKTSAPDGLMKNSTACFSWSCYEAVNNLAQMVKQNSWIWWMSSSILPTHQQANNLKQHAMSSRESNIGHLWSPVSPWLNDLTWDQLQDVIKANSEQQLKLMHRIHLHSYLFFYFTIQVTCNWRQGLRVKKQYAICTLT